MYGTNLTNSTSTASAGIAAVSLQSSQGLLSFGVLFFAFLALVTVISVLQFRISRKRYRFSSDSWIDNVLRSTVRLLRRTGWDAGRRFEPYVPSAVSNLGFR
jgi:uncharacterized membrane protein